MKKDKDFLRFQGSMIKVKMLKEYNGPNKITGILTGVNDKDIQVQVDDNILTPRFNLYSKTTSGLLRRKNNV